MRKMKHKKLYISISIVVLLFLIILATHTLWLEAIAKFLIVNDHIFPSDVIVMLGGGGPERVWNGVKLYKSGYSKHIIVTGMENRFPGLTITWPQLARKEAMSLGVSEQAIILEERPTSTYEDAVYVKEDMLSRGFKSAIIVTSPHHTRRAKMIFKKVFKDQKEISLKFTPVDGGDFQVKKWWTQEGELIGVVNEYCKLVLYLFKY
jgi:uncharacterized SAM-binding protein YcdF (DUF218 family)